ncbi:hypothetical protein Dimus_010270 [Dionaea muscipula]
MIMKYICCQAKDINVTRNKATEQLDLQRLQGSGWENLGPTPKLMARSRLSELLNMVKGNSGRKHACTQHKPCGASSSSILHITSVTQKLPFSVLHITIQPTHSHIQNRCNHGSQCDSNSMWKNTKARLNKLKHD